MKESWNGVGTDRSLLCLAESLLISLSLFDLRFGVTKKSFTSREEFADDS